MIVLENPKTADNSAAIVIPAQSPIVFAGLASLFCAAAFLIGPESHRVLACLAGTFALTLLFFGSPKLQSLIAFSGAALTGAIIVPTSAVPLTGALDLYHLAVAAMVVSVLAGVTATKLCKFMLVIASVLTASIAFSASFGAELPGMSASPFMALAVTCLFSSVLLRLSGRRFLRWFCEDSKVAQWLRKMMAVAVIGPWLFGLVLYRGFGVVERQFPVELLMLLTVTIVNVLAIYFVALRSREEEDRRQLDLVRLKIAAETDPLTNLPNRAGITSALEAAWRSFRNSGQDCTIIIFDLDHFKSINDTLGHSAGDEVLRAIKEAVEPFMRAGDMIGRWGGEEFICILPGAKSVQSQMIAERLRAAIESLTTPLSQKLGRTCVVSASFGVSHFNLNDTDPSGSIDRADAALYESKSAGRNRVSLGMPVRLVSKRAAQSASTI